MKYPIILIVLCCIFNPFKGFSQHPAKTAWLGLAVKYRFTPYSQTEVKLTSDELNLYQRLMDYRKAKGKTAIPLSRALSFTARIHAADLTDNTRPNRNFNAHSWSSKGTWSPCVYTNDHANSECSWNKPRELTSYEGDGYEMIYYDYSVPYPEAALGKWQKNSTNNDMMLNRGEWETATWNAVGIGIYGHYAAIWFGKAQDLDGKPDNSTK